MEEFNKVISTGDVSRKKMAKGANFVADIVKQTLGPKGRNVVIERSHGRVPAITNDGVTVAKSIMLDDEIENMGARTLIEVASQTNDRVGDGTTTSIVIAQAIINKYIKGDDKNILIGEDNVVGIDTKKAIDKEKDEIVKELKKLAKKVKTKEELAKVCTVSAESEELGKLIADLRWKIGVDGRLQLEDGFHQEIETELTEGMVIRGKLADPFFVNNSEEKLSKHKNLKVVVTNEEINDVLGLSNLLKEVQTLGEKKVALFAYKFSKEAIVSMAYTTKQTGFMIIPVKVPSLTTEELEDLAVFSDAKFFNTNEGESVKDVVKEDIGEINDFRSGAMETQLIGGRGNVKERIKLLKEQIKGEPDAPFRRKIENRISCLSSGIAKIKVGANSDTEKVYLKHKVEDAIETSKAAMENGTVRGGGLTLFELADKYPTLKEALKAPYEQIQANAGGNLDIPEDVVDPVDVTITALENACSVAGVFLTGSAVIANRRMETANVLQRIWDKVSTSVTKLLDGRVKERKL